jgi:hypothetical protein
MLNLAHAMDTFDPTIKQVPAILTCTHRASCAKLLRRSFLSQSSIELATARRVFPGGGEEAPRREGRAVRRLDLLCVHVWFVHERFVKSTSVLSAASPIVLTLPTTTNSHHFTEAVKGEVELESTYSAVFAMLEWMYTGRISTIDFDDILQLWFVLHGSHTSDSRD